MRRTLWLQSHVHAVAIERDMVFLDLSADAYLCLPDASDMLSTDRRSLVADGLELAGDLLSAGLVRETPIASSGPDIRLPPPARSLVHRHHGKLKASDVPEMAAGVADVFQGYRGRPLAAIAEGARRDRRSMSPRLTPEGVRTAEALHRWAPYAPLSGKCLLRSFLLLRRLRAHGADAVWVFGVRTWPFSAHCWLQCEDMVLDDHLDRVRGFTPILLV